jgi:hypothetical protein
MSASRLAPNWAFVLNAATSLAPSGRILDYGCGQGEVVAAGVERGLDIYGAEVFYGGGHGQREAVARRGLLERRVFHIIEGVGDVDWGRSMEISPPNSGPVISHGGSKIGVIIAREKISCTRTADQDSPLIATRRRTPPLGWSILGGNGQSVDPRYWLL